MLGLTAGFLLADGTRSKGSAHPRGQEQAASVAGRITAAETGRPVEGAVVRIEGTELGALSDERGDYRIHDMPAGPHVLRVDHLGFATVRIPVSMPPRGVLHRDIVLVKRALRMKEITVTADAVSRATGELGTASVIDLEAIRAQTATSLRGILELVPGVELRPPGLDAVEQVSLRAARTSGRSTGAGGIGAEDLASFGTLIVLDGVPVSNNANLQSLGPRGELSFSTSASGGVDLRRIPANTIERVEVIRGIPSVRWGDLTQGVIVVDTRAGEVEPELGAQFDARTAEGSGVWGRSFRGRRQAGTLVLDIARTRIRPGISDDDAVRVAGQFSHRASFGEAAPTPTGMRKLVLDSRLDFFRLTQNLVENPNVRIGRSDRTRNWGLRVSERARFRIGPHTGLAFTGNYSRVSQNSRISADRLRGTLPFTDRTTQGRQEGFFVQGPYRADAELDGEPQLLFGRLEIEAAPRLLGFDQKLRVGIEPRREWNSGRGQQFDIRRPLQVAFDGVRGFDRPRDFSDIGSLTTLGLYLDDRFQTVLGNGVRLQAQGGIRLDLLHEGSTWFSRIRDAVVQPRINVELAPRPWLRLRAGAGRLAKSPTLRQLFPAPQYFDVVNVNQFTNDPAERFAVLTTFIGDPTNPDLGFSRATKAEVGVELSSGGASLSLVGFRDRIHGGIAIRRDPGFLLRERFALTDSIIGNGIKPEIVVPAIGADTIPFLLDRPGNVVDQTSKGFELIASLPEVVPLRTRLQVLGSLVRTEQTLNAVDFGPRDRFVDFQLQAIDARAPFWDPPTEFGKSVLFTYRVIHHEPDAGLILTATIQHNVTDVIRDDAATDTLAFAGFITRAGDLVRVPESDRTKSEFQDLRVPRGGTLIERASTPADWFMSVQMSKTLPLGGRLNFWAFNLLDRRGIFTDPKVLPRVFPANRFGLEILLPLRGLIPGRT